MGGGASRPRGLEVTEMVAGGLVEGLGKEIPEFAVSLGLWEDQPIELPSTFHVRVARGSLDFLTPQTGGGEEQTLLARFPLRCVATWGFSQGSFQFQVPAQASLASVKENLLDAEGTEGGGVAESSVVTIRLTTTEGALIDFATMATVKSIMQSMQHLQTPEHTPEHTPEPQPETVPEPEPEPETAREAEPEPQPATEAATEAAAEPTSPLEALEADSTASVDTVPL
ncbi:hypothetical protein B484DRAFT_433724 [Ochromonadaceae sp. CCMP2298]|nr:hypothetical protein B484DRAFT_433724 [Ochromonadaceae sp. CCMP2298]